MPLKIQKKKYPDAIANWPVEDRPREKLLIKGPESLSNAELLSIFLRVGVKGKRWYLFGWRVLYFDRI